MSLIIQNISKYISLTSEEKRLFLSKTEIRNYKTKTIILNAGEVCKHSYFVNSGLLRSFKINYNIVLHVKASGLPIYIAYFLKNLETYL